jgi:hypothetical protein
MPAPRLRFTVLNTDLEGHQVEVLAGEPVSVGRTSDNTVVLDHKSVSRRHARIEANADAFAVVDLESHNGTRVGEQLIEGREAIQPGDVLRFGEVDVRFTTAEEGQEPGAAPPTAQMPRPGADEAEGAPGPAGLPAVVGEQALPAAPGERPLSFEDVFAQAQPGGEEAGEEAPARRRRVSPLLFSLLLIAVIVLGGIAIWRVGYTPPGPPVVGRKLRAGDVEPVLLNRYVGRVERIGEPDTPRVAFAKQTSFPFIVTVHGRSSGSTDIPVYGPPTGTVILRIVVAGSKPPPAWKDWLDEAPSKRVQRADELLRRARLNTPSTDVVNEKTSDAIRDYEVANELLANIPGQERRAAQAAKEARRLRKLREKRFDDLARLIETRLREGNYDACFKHVEELRRIFSDPQSPERAVVEYMNDVVVEQATRAGRIAQE